MSRKHPPLRPSETLRFVGTLILLLLLLAVTINLAGRSFGLWGDYKTRYVTVICFGEADDIRCSSEPLKVRR